MAYGLQYSLVNSIWRLPGKKHACQGIGRWHQLPCHQFIEALFYEKYSYDANYMIEGNKKYEYAAIVRATLSPYELIMLYYNGFSHSRFKG